MMPPDARWRSSRRSALRLGLHGLLGQDRAGANTSPKSWSSRSLRSVMKTSVGLPMRGSRMIFAA